MLQLLSYVSLLDICPICGLVVWCTDVPGWMSFDRFHVYAYVGLLAELLL